MIYTQSEDNKFITLKASNEKDGVLIQSILDKIKNECYGYIYTTNKAKSVIELKLRTVDFEQYALKE